MIFCDTVCQPRDNVHAIRLLLLLLLLLLVVLSEARADELVWCVRVGVASDNAHTRLPGIGQ